MTGFAKWLAAQRARRVVFIAGFFPLPGLGLLSAAIVVMVSQIRGPREAVLECGIALLVLAGMGWLAGMEVPVLLLSAVFSWAIWIGLASIVVRTGSLALAVQAAVLLALAGLVGFQVLTGDPVEYWSRMLEAIYADLAEQGLDVTADIEGQARLMSGVVIAGSLTGALLVLLLGTGLACRVSGAGHSGQFMHLRLGYVIGVLAALAGLAALFGLGFDGALLVFGAAFMFHGIAVVAWWARQLAWPGGWWIGLCIPPLLLPDFLVIEGALLSALGFVDNWYNLRRVTKSA